jgi:hypothetical protein
MLLLRKLTENVLMKIGLGELHLSRDAKSSRLLLAGPCGLPLVTLYGIDVPKNLTGKERDYVFRLVETYIVENAKDIKFLFDIRKKKRNAPKRKYNISSVGYGVSGYKLIDDKFGARLNTDTGKIDFETRSFLSKPEIIKYLSKTDEYTKALLAYKKEQDEEAILDEKIREMSTCII